MKYVMLTALLTSPVSYANDVQFCDAFADSVYAVAVQRDDGITRREMRNIILTRVDESVWDLFLLASDIAYTEPYLDPTTESDLAYEECILQRTGIEL